MIMMTKVMLLTMMMKVMWILSKVMWRILINITMTKVMWRMLTRRPLTRLGRLARARTHEDILELADA